MFQTCQMAFCEPSWYVYKFYFIGDCQLSNQCQKNLISTQDQFCFNILSKYLISNDQFCFILKRLLSYLILWFQYQVPRYSVSSNNNRLSVWWKKTLFQLTLFTSKVIYNKRGITLSQNVLNHQYCSMLFLIIIFYFNIISIS